MRKLVIRILLRILNTQWLNPTPCQYGFIGNVDAFSYSSLASEEKAGATPGQFIRCTGKSGDDQYSTEVHRSLLEPLPQFPVPEIQWTGDLITWTPARVILSTAFMATEDQRREAFKFYYGVQWDKDIERVRHEQGRPTLVINRLRSLVTASIQAEYGVGGAPLTEQEHSDLIVEITHRNMDAQRLYNYMASAAAEIAAANVLAAKSSINKGDA